MVPNPGVFLISLGLGAGFIDSIAGGGGLIALPAIESLRLILATLGIALLTLVLDRRARK
ncbi:MAG: hypothetical protein ABI681_04235 [Gemmatimonadales bacterium]